MDRRVLKGGDMKFNLDKKMVIKISILVAILLAAPFLVPFTFELVITADLLGLEALVVFLLYQSRNVLLGASAKYAELKDNARVTLILLASMYLFQPKVYLGHAAGSGLILIMTCSALLAFALWMPAIYLSLGGFG